MKCVRVDIAREAYAELALFEQIEAAARSSATEGAPLAVHVSRTTQRRCAFVAVAAAIGIPATASAHEGVAVSVEYTGDVVGPFAGAQNRGEYLDNLDIGVTLDMGRLAGWGGDTTVFVHLLNNSGGAPNDYAGSLQGVDNIEVARQGARLYEFWVETNLGAVNARAGLYDVNSEFYSNESERGAKLLREEMQSVGPVRAKDVNAAQARIVATAKDLAARNELMLAGQSAEDELIY